MPAQVEDIRKETLIRKKWNSRNAIQHFYPDGILVTGANSFIGCHVISILQRIYSGQIHLLIRASSVHDAKLKMNQAFKRWDLEDFDHSHAIIHLGDVSLNMMGLSNAEYVQVKKQTSRVIHLAMTPMYHLPYHHFKRVWIPELERMISFCNDENTPKSLHYTSSFNTNFFTHDDDFKALNTNVWQSGYAGFKWVASQSIQHAMRKNLRGCIYDIPLALGSGKTGKCPGHYSIWMILDIFLKTGCFFPFSLRIIPVDVLAEIIVTNVLKEHREEVTSFIRPFLYEPVTDKLISNTVACILGLKNGNRITARKAYQNKQRFDFIIPENFDKLMEKVISLPAIWPAGFDDGKLPSTPMVFMSNLNQALSVNKELTKV